LWIMLKLGILVDGHGHKTNTRKLVSRFNKEKVDAILVNGDFAEDEGQYQSMRSMLKLFKQSKAPVYVMPGSHENSKPYKSTVGKAKKPIYDCMKARNRKVTINGYDLVFLPGSDWVTPRASFMLLEHKRRLKARLKTARIRGIKCSDLVFSSMTEINKLITRPQKTMVVGHIPPRFSSKHGLDVANFGITTKEFTVPTNVKGRMRRYAGKTIGIQNVIPLPYGKDLADAGYPVKIMKKNVGNIGLKKVLVKNKIKYFVCGHIHESGQRAVTANGRKVKSKHWSNSLFLNAGPAKEGKGALFIIKDGKASFQKV